MYFYTSKTYANFIDYYFWCTRGDKNPKRKGKSSNYSSKETNISHIQVHDSLKW